MAFRIQLLAAASIALLAGCATDLSGVGGNSTFKCAAPDGVPCMSMTGIAHNVDAGTLPAMQRSAADEGRLTKDDPDGKDGKSAGAKDTPPPLPAYGQSFHRTPGTVSPAEMETPFSGMPVRTPPTLLRAWIAPVESTTGALHDQRYITFVVEDGKWKLDHTQANLMRAFRPTMRISKPGEPPSENIGTPSSSTTKQGASGPDPVRMPGGAPIPKASGF